MGSRHLQCCSVLKIKFLCDVCCGSSRTDSTLA